MGLTICYKILKDHLVKGELVKGNPISIKIDQTLTQDATGTMAYLEFESMGVEYFDEAGNVALNSPETQAALDLMKYMYDKKYVAPVGASNQANFAGGEGIMLFHSQSISITESSLAALSKYKGKKMSEVFDVCTFPLINYNETPKIG